MSKRPHRNDPSDPDWLDRWIEVAPFGRDDETVVDKRGAWLDEEFPLGDGVADVESTVVCPYCGETNAIAVDPGSGDHQEYVEDCQVCCRP